LVTQVSAAKTAEPTEMLFVRQNRVDPENYVSDGGAQWRGANWRIRLNDAWSAAIAITV